MTRPHYSVSTVSCLLSADSSPPTLCLASSKYFPVFRIYRNIEIFCPHSTPKCKKIFRKSQIWRKSKCKRKTANQRRICLTWCLWWHLLTKWWKLICVLWVSAVARHRHSASNITAGPHSNVELGISGQHRLAVVTKPRFRYKFYNHGEGFLLIESIYILALSHIRHF